MHLPKINRYKIEMMKQNSSVVERTFYYFGRSKDDAINSLKETLLHKDFMKEFDEPSAIHYRITEDEENILQPKSLD